jgi:hypothetical protein
MEHTMVIVFFEYEAKAFFFGVTAGKQITRCSSSREEVASELHALQLDEWGASVLEEFENHVQGFVLRSLQYVDGRWVVVDVEEGLMTIVAEMDGERVSFTISASDPSQVVSMDEPEEIEDSTRQLGSRYG